LILMVLVNLMAVLGLFEPDRFGREDQARPPSTACL
jgi:hypothetical protein